MGRQPNTVYDPASVEVSTGLDHVLVRTEAGDEVELALQISLEAVQNNVFTNQTAANAAASNAATAVTLANEAKTAAAAAIASFSEDITPNTVAKRDTRGFLYSKNPFYSDVSRKVATTKFVQEKIDALVGPTASNMLDTISELSAALNNDPTILSGLELKSRKVEDFSNPTSTELFPCNKAVTTALAVKQDVANLSTNLQTDSTRDDKYPSTKIVFDALAGKADDATTTASLNLKQELSNLSTNLQGDSASTSKYPCVKIVFDALGGKADDAATTASLNLKQTIANLSTNLQTDSTRDDKYPSAKIVFDALAGKADDSATTASLNNKVNVSDVYLKLVIDHKLNKLVDELLRLGVIASSSDAAAVKTAIAGIIS